MFSATKGAKVQGCRSDFNPQDLYGMVKERFPVGHCEWFLEAAGTGMFTTKQEGHEHNCCSGNKNKNSRY